jgi:hypothetical protein
VQCSLLLNEMWLGLSPYSIISLLVGVMAQCVGLYVLSRGPDARTIRMIFLIAIIFTVGSILDFLFLISPDEQAAMHFGQMLIFTLVIMFGSYMYLAIMMLPLRYQQALEARWGIIWAFIIASGLFCAWNVQSVHMDRFGWAISYEGGLGVAITYGLAYSMIAVGLLQYASYRSKDPKLWRQNILLSLAIMIPFLYGAVLYVFDFYTHMDLPRLLSPAFIIGISLTGYAVLRYRMFLVAPRQEDHSQLRAPTAPRMQLRPGQGYLFEAKRSDQAYEVLIDALREGNEGLVISREHPDIVRQKYSLAKTPIVWLTSHPGNERVDPTNLSILQHTVNEFLKRSKSPIILLDGVEYLILNNKMEKVLQVVLTLKDEVSINDGVLLLPVDPETFETRALALLERDFEIVGCPVGQAPFAHQPVGIATTKA